LAKPGMNRAYTKAGSKVGLVAKESSYFIQYK
jgi:hypothetical protein